MRKQIELAAPAAWINRRHEDIQRNTAIEQDLDRRIAHAYATDSEEMPGITLGDVVKVVAVYTGIVLTILASQ